MPYTTFREQVQASNVAEITSQGDAIQGSFKQAGHLPADRRQAADVHRVRHAAADVRRPGARGAARTARAWSINARPLDEGRGWLLTLLLSFGPALLFFGLLIWMVEPRPSGAQRRRLRHRAQPAKRYEPTDEQPRITFADVAGIDEAEAELQSRSSTS